MKRRQIDEQQKLLEGIGLVDVPAADETLAKLHSLQLVGVGVSWNKGMFETAGVAGLSFGEFVVATIDCQKVRENAAECTTT